MIPLSSAISGGLTWSRLPWNRGHELKRNGEVIASLHKGGFGTSSFIAKTAGVEYTFRPSGWLGNSAQILDSASRQPLAEFKSPWGSAGTLTFADGQSFQFKREGWWRPVWSVIGAGGVIVMRLHMRGKNIELTSPGLLADSRMLLLAMFTWYQVLKAEEAASAAVVVAAIS